MIRDAEEPEPREAAQYHRRKRDEKPPGCPRQAPVHEAGGDEPRQPGGILQPVDAL